MKVLFLDLAKRTGWAHASERPGVPVSGVIRLDSPSESDFGPVYAQLRQEVIILLRRTEIEAVGYESAVQAMSRRFIDPETGRPATSPRILRLLNGYAATIECLVAEWKLPCFEVPANTIKKNFVGHGHADKQQVIALCRRLGWAVADDNAADACAGWSYLSALLDKQFTLRSTR